MRAAIRSRRPAASHERRARRKSSGGGASSEPSIMMTAPSHASRGGHHGVPFSISRVSRQPPQSRPRATPRPSTVRGPASRRSFFGRAAFAGSDQLSYPSQYRENGGYSNGTAASKRTALS